MSKFFRTKDGTADYMIIRISDAELDRLLNEPNENGVTPRFIVGYPRYVTPTGRLFPEPMDGVEVFDGDDE